MDNLLLDDYPLIILPSLAKEVGLNESIILQQLHYWLKKSTNERDGYKWVYNTYEDWVNQFPFWSVSTIRRTVTKLENANLIIVGNYNKLKIDNTKWYRINYPLLQHMSRPSVQNEQTTCSNWTDDLFKMNRPLPETTTETTSEITEDIYIPPSAHKSSPKKPAKKKYAEHVSLTEEEYQKLVAQFGKEGTQDKIENLNLYKGSKGKKYKSDYMTILSWHKKELKQKGGGQSERLKENERNILEQYNFNKERPLNF